MANIKTITLGGTEQVVKLAGQNCDIRNDSADTVYASAVAGISADADGVVSIPVGQAVKLLDTRGTVYLIGTGKVQLCGNDYSDAVFKCAPSGGGGSSEVTKTYVDNGDDTALKLAKQYAEETFSNPNLLDNPWFGKGVINQRGKTEYSGAGYSIDRWSMTANTKLTVNDNSITISASGGDGWFSQSLPDSGYFTGRTFTASLYLADGTVVSGSGVCPERTDALQRLMNVALPNDIGYLRMYRTKESDGDKGLTCDVMLTDSNSAELKGLKVEFGVVATPFVLPDPATELVKCQRYYIGAALEIEPRALTSNVYYMNITLPVTMRIAPSLEDGYTITLRDRTTNAVTDVLNDATVSLAKVSVVRSNAATLSFAKSGHGITELKYNGTLFGGLSADL